MHRVSKSPDCLATCAAHVREVLRESLALPLKHLSCFEAAMRAAALAEREACAAHVREVLRESLTPPLKHLGDVAAAAVRTRETHSARPPSEGKP